jgi:signal transduction histidine kinase
MLHDVDCENALRELQEAQRRIARLERSLVETQRLATVGELACRTIHEFNNLLMIIIGRAGEALKHGDGEAREKALRKAVECGQRAADIAAGLLGYATADALMDAAVGLVAWDLSKTGIQLLRQYDSRAAVRVIPGRLEQVLVNLILNARAAMRQRGGRLTVAVIEAETPGYVALKVQDAGCGIPPEHLDKIFDPFFTTRPRHGNHENGQDDRGTGLGLPVARDLVRQAGGDIHVESTPGAGSVFTVLLPIAQEDPPAAPGTPN